MLDDTTVWSNNQNVYNLTWLTLLCDLLHRRRKSLFVIEEISAEWENGVLKKTFWQLVISLGLDCCQAVLDHSPLMSFRPSWPNLLRPQPNTAPERVSAKLWAPPADIWAKGMPWREWMIWGVAMLCPLVPSPSCPYRFWPQEKTLPPMFTINKQQKRPCKCFCGNHNNLHY